MDTRYAERYGDLETWHWWFRGRRRILESVLQRALRGAPARTLATVGCGPAEGTTWLRRFVAPGGCLLALDRDQRHARALGPGFTFVVGDLRAAPVRTGAVDTLLALDVLEHLDDDAAGLRETKRLLQPGGLLVVTVPASPSLWGSQDVISHHLRRYTARTLRETFARARLPQPFVSHFNTLLLPPAAAVRWARRATSAAARPRSDFEDNRPGLVNDLLAAVFGSERHLVGRVALPVGVSLLATVRVGA
jgi:SAM-dependent methyltransferase